MNGVESGAGGFVSTNPSFGPYLQAAPTNPLTNTSKVADIAATPSSTDGWYYNSVTGAFTGASSTGALSDTGN